MTVPRESFRFTADRPREFVSTAPVIRTFCDRCGTMLTYTNRNDPSQLDVTVASLDEPGAYGPLEHIWMSDAVPWDRPADGLPQHAGWRTGN
jgi:hypothetical protein